MRENKMQNDRFLRALFRQPVDRTPVWMMRQAGRYLPEYREVRAKAKNFMTLCKTPELACEVTLQPLRRYNFDAAILFSDILTIPDAMGLGLNFVENEGPVFVNPVRQMSDIVNLIVPQPELHLQYVLEAIRLIKAELANRVPLIGFCGSPWTLATYMVEGKSSRDFSVIKKMRYSSPALLQQLLAKLTEASFNYLKAQINAGVNAVMIFDTWGGVLTPDDYGVFSLQSMRKIVAGLKNDPDTCHVPIILFSKNRSAELELIADTGCDAISLDWTIDIGVARQRVGARVALQGNLDPHILHASDNAIRRGVAKVLAAFGHGNGHVFNLGHGITPDIAPEKVQVMVEAVRELSAQYHHE